MAGDGDWKPVGLVKDISPDTKMLRVALDGESVCLYDLGERICATQDKCPHGNASLSEGYVDGGLIECPLHQGLFEIETGKPKGPPVTTELKCYQVKVDNGTVYLRAGRA